MKAQTVAVVDPDCFANDAGLKAMSLIGTPGQSISTGELACQYPGSVACRTAVPYK